MKNATRKVGKRFLTFLLAFVLAFSLVIPASMADNENEDTEDEEVVVDVDTEEAEIEEDVEASPEETEADIDAEVDISGEDAEAFEPYESSEDEIMMLDSDSDQDNAYLKALTISKTVDGQAPFDEDDEPGNDSGDSNGIVRSFDYVNYTLSFTTGVYDDTKTVHTADMYVEFTLSCGPETAQFNMSTMNWMQDSALVYVLEDGSTEPSDNYNQYTDTVVRQILTGVRVIRNDEEETDLIPGAGTISSGIYVSAAANGTELNPEFSAWINGENTDKITAQSEEPLVVSAAQKYNIAFRQSSEMNIYGTYDISSGTSDEKSTQGTISENTSLRGRMEGYGITVMMENDSDEKGLKGLEFPNGDITFDLTLSEQAENKNGDDLSKKAGYTPVIWDYDANLRKTAANGGEYGLWGRMWKYTNSANMDCAYQAAPFNKLGCHTYSTIYDSCYDGGSWYMKQDEKDPLVYHVTISDYTIDYENFNFPSTYNTWYARTEGGTIYSAKQACLSAGTIQMVLQFPTEAVGAPTYIYYKMTADNFAVGGKKFDTTATYTNTYELVPEGSIQSGVNFTTDKATNRATATEQLGTYYTSGDAYSFAGSNIRLWGYVGTSTDETVRTEATLIKFDASAFEINRGDSYSTEGHYAHGSGDGQVNSYEFYFAGRQTNWESDKEMSDTLINSKDLHYYKSLDELEASEYNVCVGILYIADVEKINNSSQSQAAVGLTVKDDVDINEVYAACNDAWASYSTLEDLEKLHGAPINSDGSINTDWAEGYSLYRAYCSADAYKTMGKSSSTDESYQKTEYDDDGNIIGGHDVGYYGGTSLLICGEECRVEVSFDQKIYDMDVNERTAAVTVQPTVTVDGGSSSGAGQTTTTDVTVKVTLPADLTYDIGSAYYGETPVTPVITYTYDDEGNITGTILSFTLQDVTVGETLPAITFTTTIGHAGTADDVENNQSVSITAEIQSTNDHRLKDASYGNISSTSFNIVRLSLLSISKQVDSAMIEMDGEFTWTYRFGNASEDDEHQVRLADRLPFTGDENGSLFSGSYEITSITLDFSDAPETLKENEGSMHFYVTNDPNVESSGELADEEEDDPMFNSWTDLLKGVSFSGDTVTLDTGTMSDMTAYDFDIGTVFSNEYITFTMHVETTGNQPGDVYHNVFDENGDMQASVVASNNVETYVAKRSISGLTWYDANKNGIREDDEDLISGIEVSLYRTDPSGYSDTGVPEIYIRNDKGVYVGLYTAYDVYGNKVGAVKTYDLSKGMYEFDCLEAGTYYVLFDGVSDYVLTEMNAGNDPARDSDAHAIYSDGALSYAYISDIELLSLDQMEGYIHESIDNDAGFYNSTVNVTVIKEWDDNDNQDGKRPDSIEVVLTGTDGSMHFYDVTEEDGWELTISDLPGYYNGVEIEYSLHEVSDGVYTPEVVMEKTEDGYIFTITNNYIPAVIDIPVVKIWDDDENRDNARPGSVTVTLTGSDGKTYEATLDESNGWAYLFKDLPEYYEEGTEIAYTLTESSVDGYTAEIVPYLEGYGFTVTNSHTPDTISIPVEKIWDDSDNMDGARPEAITVILSGSDGSLRSLILADVNDWKGTFTNLPVNYHGEEIVYSVREEYVYGYTGTVTGNAEDGYTITNSHIPYTTNVSVTKVWDDNNDQDGIRPDSIEVTLTGSNGYTETADLTKDNGYYYVFTDLDMYDDGKLVDYEVTEAAIDGYGISSYVKSADGYQITITNRHTPDVTSITVNKDWDDNEDMDGIRPVTVTVILSGTDGSVHEAVLSEANGWTYTFENLPVKGSGKNIEYSVHEEYVDGYTDAVTENDDGSFTVTNSHKPATTNVSVTKEWNDNDDQDGIRPTEVYVTLTGTAAGETVYDETVALTADNEYYYVFTGLPVYSNGVLIDYSVTEADVDGYTARIIEGSDGYTFTVRNSHTPEKTSVTVSKVWEDDDDRDGKRPGSVTVILTGGNESYMAVLSDSNDWTFTFTNLPVYANGEEIKYQATEFAVSGYDGTVTQIDDYTFTLTNKHEPETTSISGLKIWDDADNQDGIRPGEITVNLFADGDYVMSTTVTAAGGWYYSFDNLTKYRDGGEEIVYTVTETLPDDVAGEYTGTVSGTNFINRHIPYTVDIPVQKIWDDYDNQDGRRTDSVTVYLTGGGNVYSAVLTAENDWSYVFEGLPKRQNGVDIVYTLYEAPVNGYTAEVITNVDEEGNYSFTVTNTYEPALIDIPVAKVWDDADNQDGIRPAMIEVTLEGSDGNKYKAQLSEENGYMATFTNLPVYFDEGTLIDYELSEETISEYQGTVTKDGTGYAFTVENSHVPYTTEVTVEKVWNDDDNRDGIRPGSIDVILTGSDGSAYQATLTADNGWSYTFTDLPVNYAEGTTIDYELTEAVISGYEDPVITKTGEGYAFTVENTHEPKLTEIPVTKVWADNDDELGYRPEEIEVTLTGTAGGETVYENTVTITADDDWTYLFENLFVYANGQQITYTVSETPVVDYYTDIDGNMRSGYEITNTVIAPKLDKEIAEDDYERKEAEGSDMHEGEDTDGNGFGTWDDADNNQEVTFLLTLTDIKGAVNLSLHDYLESQFDFELDTVDVILYEGENGYYLREDIDYTLSEGECSDPDCIMAGCTFEVRFADEVFQDISPDAYIVVTYRSLTDTHVDDYEDFVDQIFNDAYILYGTSALMHRTAIAETETDLFGFEALKYVDEGSELLPLEGAGFTLSRADGMYAVLETETGSDGNEYYLVTGWTDDIGYAGILVSGTDGMIRVEGLDDDTYMLDEMAAPAGYYELEASVAFTITEEGTLTDCDSLLTIENETMVGVENEKILTSVTGTKTWDDSDNLDGMRPEEITVRLYADGEEVDSTTVTAADDWTYTFEDLVAYKDGQEIVYTISEDEVDGYTTAYDGYDIVNTHETEKTSVSVTKVWEDENDADGIRPDRITVILTADGQMTGYYLVLDEDNGWTGTFENLDKYADGNLIQYDIYEPDVDGYKTTLTGSADDGFILTNTHTPDKNDDGGNGGNGGNDGGNSGGGDNGGNTGTTGGNTGTTGGNTGTTGGTTGSSPSSSGSGTTGTGNVQTGEIIGMSAAGLAALAAIIGIIAAVTTTRKRIENEERSAKRLRK